MPTFIDNNGEKFEAQNAKDLVKQMAATSFDGTDTSLQQYMLEVANRAEVAASVTLRHDNCESFVSDMLINSLLKVEE